MREQGACDALPTLNVVKEIDRLDDWRNVPWKTYGWMGEGERESGDDSVMNYNLEKEKCCHDVLRSV